MCLPCIMNAKLFTAGLLLSFWTQNAVAFSAMSPKKTQKAGTGSSSRLLIPELKEMAIARSKEESTKQAENVPWDALRFVRQSSKFISLPNPFAGSKQKKKVQPGELMSCDARKVHTSM
jgi:hypothetical protein